MRDTSLATLGFSATFKAFTGILLVVSQQSTHSMHLLLMLLVCASTGTACYSSLRLKSRCSMLLLYKHQLQFTATKVLITTAL
jgi:hypothetical protein